MKTWLDRGIHCIDQLEETQLWYRPNKKCNAIGNLVLHLVGNLRQWILSGIDNQPDTRNRPAEFNAESGYSKVQLRDLLKKTVEQCCKVIEKMPSDRVLEKKTIQGTDTTIGAALVMAVSHLGLHVGQIQYVGKMLLSEAYVESWMPKDSMKK
jgi:hypothetical protein